MPSEPLSLPVEKFNQCKQCQKIHELCVCNHIHTQANQLHVLILQHPQEPDHEIGSARLTHLALANSSLKIGLSWRNLAAALGRKEANPAHWAVLYLGSGVKADRPLAKGLYFVSQKGLPVANPERLEGIVVLDGTWSQAKTLWWRNAWLLKLRRAILLPDLPSLYGKLRKEPRKECLATIESVAAVLQALGERPEVSLHLKDLFGQLLTQRRNQYIPKKSE